jgi:hypothetical protein
MIEYKRKKFAWIFSHSAKQPQEKIAKCNPQVKFSQLYID